VCFCDSQKPFSLEKNAPLNTEARYRNKLTSSSFIIRFPKEECSEIDIYNMLR